jgi:hypothetical protein
MTAAEITAAMESGDYSAEMVLQHVIRLYNAERSLADRLAGSIDRMPWIYGIGEKEEAEQSLSSWKEARKP